MPANKKSASKTANSNKQSVKDKAATNEKPEQFEEQRSTALRMKPQPLGKSPTPKNKK